MTAAKISRRSASLKASEFWAGILRTVRPTSESGSSQEPMATTSVPSIPWRLGPDDVVVQVAGARDHGAVGLGEPLGGVGGPAAGHDDEVVVRAERGAHDG
jgi:hypothetical protein